MIDNPQKQRSKHALAVAITWGACMAATMLVHFVLLFLLRSDAISWRGALPLMGLWSALAISIVMWVAVAAIHRLEREPRSPRDQA
jgi:hypothetical protein